MSSIFSVHSLVCDFLYDGKQYEEVKISWFFMDRRPDMTTRIEEIELPVSPNASGCRRLPRGDGNDFYILHREKAYSLPFKVEGYFSVRFAELKVSGDDGTTVIIKRS